MPILFPWFSLSFSVFVLPMLLSMEVKFLKPLLFSCYPARLS